MNSDAKTGLHWYPWFPADYQSDTRDLDCMEHGCYRQLLDASWEYGPLPTNIDRLRRLACNPPVEVLRFILERYWFLDTDGWRNRRLEEIRQAQLAQHERRRRAGSKGGRARMAAILAAPPEPEPEPEPYTDAHSDAQNAHSDAQNAQICAHDRANEVRECAQQAIDLEGESSIAQALPRQCLSNQNQNQIEEALSTTKPSSTTDNSRTRSGRGSDWGFEEFWTIWPRKADKDRARKAWRGLTLNQKRAAYRDVRDSGRFDGVDPQYIPYASTYLRGKRWEDAVEARPKPAAASKGNGHTPRTPEQWVSWGEQNGCCARPGETMEAFLARARASYARAESAS